MAALEAVAGRGEVALRRAPTRPSPATALDRIAGSSPACSWARSHHAAAAATSSIANDIVAAASAARACTSSGRRRRGQSRLREPPAVVVVPAQPPVEPQLPGHPGGRLDVAGGHRALGGRGEVGVLEVDAGEGGDLAAVAVARVVGRGHLEVVRRVGACGLLPLARLVEQVAGVLGHRLQEPQPTGGLGDHQGVLDERLEAGHELGASEPRTAPPPTRGPTGWCRRRTRPSGGAGGGPAASRSPWLQSRVARMVRCRGGRSRGPASRARVEAIEQRGRVEQPGAGRGELEGERQARRASGRWRPPRPPRSGSEPQPGLTRCARSSSSRAAGDGVPSGRSCTSSGSTAYSVSPRTRSGARLVVSTVRSGTASTSAATSGAASRRCSALSRTSSRSCPRRLSTSVLGHRASGVADDADRVGDGRQHLVDLEQRGELDEPDAVGVALAHAGGHGQDEARLPHAAGSAERDQAAGVRSRSPTRATSSSRPMSGVAGAGRPRGARAATASRRTGARTGRDRAEQGRPLALVEVAARRRASAACAGRAGCGCRARAR